MSVYIIVGAVIVSVWVFVFVVLTARLAAERVSATLARQTVIDIVTEAYAEGWVDRSSDYHPRVVDADVSADDWWESQAKAALDAVGGEA